MSHGLVFRQAPRSERLRPAAARWLSLLWGQRRLALSVLLLALAQACSESEGELPESWIGAERVVLQHPSGLEVELPQGLYTVEQTADGFRIEARDAARRRSPFEIHIALIATAGPEGDWPESRRLHGHDVRYRIDVGDGGSGGQLHHLLAWQGLGDVHLRLEHTVQVEPPARPDFTDGWAVLGSSRVP